MLTPQKNCARYANFLTTALQRSSKAIGATQRRGDGNLFLLEHSSPRPLIRQRLHIACMEEDTMDGLIYLVGLIVIILFILSFFGLR